LLRSSDLKTFAKYLSVTWHIEVVFSALSFWLRRVDWSGLRPNFLLAPFMAWASSSLHTSLLLTSNRYHTLPPFTACSTTFHGHRRLFLLALGFRLLSMMVTETFCCSKEKKKLWCIPEIMVPLFLKRHVSLINNMYFLHTCLHGLFGCVNNNEKKHWK
jgi:hypothetical protein